MKFADDTNVVHTHLPSLRALATCYLKEAAFYGFRVNNDPETGQCYVIALNPDLPHVVIRDLTGRALPVVDEAVTLGLTYGPAFGTASIFILVRISKMQEVMNQCRFVWQFDVSFISKSINRKDERPRVEQALLESALAPSPSSPPPKN